MKILYLDQSGQLGGGEIALLPWLCLNREQSLVLLFEDGPFRERLQQEGVAVQVVDMTGLKQVRRESGWKSAVSSVPALLRKRVELRNVALPFDVIYANSMKSLIVAALIRRWRQPVVWHLRDILSGDHFSAPLRFVVSLIANCCASAIIANSQATATAFTDGGGNRKKLTVVYDGVCGSTFGHYDESAVQALRAEFAAPGRILLGVFSRLSAWKGQHIVLDAVSTVPDVDLLIVGDALFGEWAYADALRKRTTRQDLAGRVTFLGFRRDTAKLMQCVDIVIHSSTSAEPFGLVIVEGMLAGKPVIATDAGGAAEIVQDGRSGVLVTPASVMELRQAILDLSNDPALRHRLGEAGRLRATEAFPLQAMYTGIRGVLQRFEPQGTRRPAEAVPGAPESNPVV